MLVKKQNSSSDHLCNSRILLEYWQKIRKKASQTCSVYHCREAAVGGSVVRKLDLFDSSLYVIPLCPAHATQSEALILREPSDLILAQVVTTPNHNFCNKAS